MTCPYKLPLSVGTTHGSSPDQIYDATNQAVLILYSVCSRGTVDEARSMKWNLEGLKRADYVVKAVNEHEQLVARVDELEKLMRETLADINDLEQHVTKITNAGCEILEIVAKPVDRRKD